MTFRIQKFIGQFVQVVAFQFRVVHRVLVPSRCASVFNVCSLYHPAIDS